MMVNECGHPLCKNCVENLFVRNAGPCHVCGKTLRKNNFWEQVFDDPLIEKETHIRRRLRKIYNLKKDDFPSLREFNDYLERFECLVCNLAFGIDVEDTEAEIAAFKEANAELIEKNKKRLDEDQIWIMQNLKEDRDMKTRVGQAHSQESLSNFSSAAKLEFFISLFGRLFTDVHLFIPFIHSFIHSLTHSLNRAFIHFPPSFLLFILSSTPFKEVERSAVKDTKAIMEELRESNVPAEVILDRERKRQIEQELEEKEEAARRKKRNKEILQDRKRMAESMSFSTSQRVSGRAFEYKAPRLHINGPPLPVKEELETKGYLQHIRAASLARVAGGFTTHTGCLRALFDSRIDLLSF
ncbi:hypothetical protein Y032_0494g2461 [Ancylostoma ceylanicum]|nr:hypothetical protein Y032_0494g2461 [Ancylostoma ceylanicum]